jgi:hypothetical protein
VSQSKEFDTVSFITVKRLENLLWIISTLLQWIAKELPEKPQKTNTFVLRTRWMNMIKGSVSVCRQVFTPAYYTGTYLYKSYSKMFRLIHVTIIREYKQGSCLFTNT